MVLGGQVAVNGVGMDLWGLPPPYSDNPVFMLYQYQSLLCITNQAVTIQLPEDEPFENSIIHFYIFVFKIMINNILVCEL